MKSIIFFKILLVCPSSGDSSEAEGAILSQFSLRLPFSERPGTPFFELKSCNIHSVLLRPTLLMISGNMALPLAVTPSHRLQIHGSALC